MLTEKDYCDYETCVALKELGHDEKCHGYYEPQKRCFNTTSIKHSWCNSEIDDIGVIICPTLYEAQKWLREEKGIEIVVHSFDYVGEPYFADIHMYREVRCACSYADSYEKAISEGVKYAVKILKEK